MKKQHSIWSKGEIPQATAYIKTESDLCQTRNRKKKSHKVMNAEHRRNARENVKKRGIIANKRIN